MRGPHLLPLVLLAVAAAVLGGALQERLSAYRVSWAPMTASPHHPQLYVVDALEGPHATLESDGGERLVLPRSWLPSAAGEGSVVTMALADRDGRMHVTIEVDEAATEERRTALRERRERIPKGPSGDLDL
jgi:hypothetical protein